MSDELLVPLGKIGLGYYTQSLSNYIVVISVVMH